MALYVKDTLKYSTNNSIQTGDDSESVWVNIHKGKDKLTLGVLYRPTNLSRQDTAILLQEVNVCDVLTTTCTCRFLTETQSKLSSCIEAER